VLHFDEIQHYCCFVVDLGPEEEESLLPSRLLPPSSLYHGRCRSCLRLRCHLLRPLVVVAVVGFRI